MNAQAKDVIPATQSKMRNTKDLRAFLVQQMECVADGTTDIAKAKGIANLAQQVYNTLNIEIKLAKAKADVGENFGIDGRNRQAHHGSHAVRRRDV